MNQLGKLLVVLDGPDSRAADGPDPALERAFAIADRAGSEIRLFSVCHDAAITPSIFSSPESAWNEREQQVDDRFAWLEGIAQQARERGYAASAAACWHYPPEDAVIREAVDVDTDLVLKTPADHGYLAGIFTNTDWELIRRCPVGCWFAKRTSPGDGSVLACIDPTLDADTAHQRAALDYTIHETAIEIAKTLGRPVDVVNAIRLPASLRGAMASHAPGIELPAGDPPFTDANRSVAALAARHASLLRAFAEHFGHPVEKIIVEQGHPAKVILRAAERRESSLIVMGALERSRLARALLGVNAEPVLAGARCDVLFLKGAGASGQLEDLDTPEVRRGSAASPVSLLARVDVERALADPSAQFDDPLCVNRRPDLSLVEKKRILEAWEHDEIRLQESAYEGERVSDEASALRAVKAAARLLPEVEPS